jgi:hypothetical protein
VAFPWNELLEPFHHTNARVPINREAGQFIGSRRRRAFSHCSMTSPPSAIASLEHWHRDAEASGVLAGLLRNRQDNVCGSGLKVEVSSAAFPENSPFRSSWTPIQPSAFSRSAWTLNYIVCLRRRRHSPRNGHLSQ